MRDEPVVRLDYPLTPSFRGLNERQPIQFYLRHLPHWRQEGATYAVTFRLADAIPQTRLRELRRLREDWEARAPAPRTEADWEEYARQFTRRVNAWMDEGHGACQMQCRELATIVAESLKHFDGVRYELGAYVVMPNHCHVVVRPADGWRLEALIGAWKQHCATRINEITGRRGILWQGESYDRIIRNSAHLWHSVQYIGSNPVKAGLRDQEWRRWLSPVWREHNWHFIDEPDPRRHRP